MGVTDNFKWDGLSFSIFPKLINHIDVSRDKWSSRVFPPAGSYTLTVSKAGFGQRGRLSMVALSGAIAFQGAVPWQLWVMAEE